MIAGTFSTRPATTAGAQANYVIRIITSEDLTEVVSEMQKLIDKQDGIYISIITEGSTKVITINRQIFLCSLSAFIKKLNEIQQFLFQIYLSE